MHEAKADRLNAGEADGDIIKRLRVNAGWRNERFQCVADPDLLTNSALRIEALLRTNADLERALISDNDGSAFGFPLTSEKIEEIRALHDFQSADVAEQHIRTMARMWGCTPGFAAHHIKQDDKADRSADLERKLVERGEALAEARLIVANLPHDESLFLAKIDAALKGSSK